MRSNIAIAILCLFLGAALAEWLSTRDAHAQALPPSSGGSDACTGQACTVSSLTSSGGIQGTTGAFSGAITSTVGSGNDAIILQANAQIQDASASTNWCRFDGTNFACNSGLVLINGDLTMTGVGKYIDLYGSMAIRNSAANTPLNVNDADGLLITPKSSVPTCGTVPEGTIYQHAGSAGTKTKQCLCTYDGTTYAWQSMISATVGDTTTCPS